MPFGCEAPYAPFYNLHNASLLQSAPRIQRCRRDARSCPLPQSLLLFAVSKITERIDDHPDSIVIRILIEIRGQQKGGGGQGGRGKRTQSVCYLIGKRLVGNRP